MALEDELRLVHDAGMHLVPPELPHGDGGGHAWFLELEPSRQFEGDVSIEYTGHEAAARKELTEKQSDSQREEVLKNILKRYASAAEFSNIKIENVNDPEKPLIYRSYLRVPGYAQRTGKRLFFTPSTSFRKLFMIFCLPCGARFSVQRRTSVRRGPVERRGARNCGLKPTAAR